MVIYSIDSKKKERVKADLVSCVLCWCIFECWLLLLQRAEKRVFSDGHGGATQKASERKRLSVCPFQLLRDGEKE